MLAALLALRIRCVRQRLSRSLSINLDEFYRETEPLKPLDSAPGNITPPPSAPPSPADRLTSR